MNKRSKFFNEDFKNKAIDLFNQGVKSKDIVKKLNISKTALIKNLNLLGYNFDRSISMQKYTLNIEYFKNINTEKKAYWLGLIYADGSNKISDNTFTIGLKEEDSYILEKLKMDLNYNNSIKIQKDKRENRKPFYVLSIYNIKFCNFLKLQGVFQNKTFILNAPNLSENLIPHFIRGYFDGDGGLVTNCNKFKHYKDSINFTGTLELLTYISEEFKKLDINTSIYKRHKNNNNNNYTIIISGRLNVIRACEYMYNESGDYKLIRKYEKFQTIKNRYD